ncbi:hydrolase 76 protein [Boothiomyces sp. JEL0866]|nr:hydrolase 76 protein [Boothiomyces sp. JEL0866]
MLVLTAALLATARALDLNNEQAVRQANAQIASNLMSYYTPNSKGVIPDFGDFPWYEGGVMWGAMMEYIKTSGNDTFSRTVVNALTLASEGTVGSFLTSDENEGSVWLGRWNDDILWWAMGSLTGTEMYGNVKMPGGVTFLNLTTTTFNQVYSFWDSSCSGGIMWARDKSSSKYGYKSTITNAQEMMFGARLYSITKDMKYLNISKQLLAWLKIRLIQADYTIYDGINKNLNCGMVPKQHSYLNGMVISGLVHLARATGDQNYMSEAEAVYKKAISYFSRNGVIADECEPNCETGHVSFKGVFIRGIGELYTYTANSQLKSEIKIMLANTMKGMLNTCDSTLNCGNLWYTNTKEVGVHFELNALELITAYAKTFGMKGEKMVAPTQAASLPTTTTKAISTATIPPMPFFAPTSTTTTTVAHTTTPSAETTQLEPVQVPAEPLPSNYLNPVELPDVKTIIPRESPESFIFRHNCLVVGRQLEIMNVILGYEQANKYSLNTIDGQNVGIICEEESTFKSAILRQMFRTRREYNADLLDLGGNLLYKIKRPFKWFLNSTIKIYYKDEEIGFVKSDWHLWRRRYDLFVQNEQFARIDMGLWAWDFEARDNEQQKLSDINRNFMGIMKEIFTDMGKYIVHYDATIDANSKLSLDQRAVLLACAMSIDIDYFSRHSNANSHGMMPMVAAGEVGGPSAPPVVVPPADVGSTMPNVTPGIPNVGPTPDMTSNIPNMNSSEIGSGKNQWGDDAFLTDEQANIASEGFESASEEGSNLIGKLWDFFNND